MSTDKLDLKAADFDANVWWHLTEGRVDDYKKKEFSSQFAQADNGIMDVGPERGQYWQLQPVDDVAGRYALRCSKTGVFKQLGVCYVADEIANSKTQPCLVSSSGADAQKWDVADWGNSTYRFVNVANGTGYVLDVHPGNPPFMSDDLRTNIPQPAQHWLMTSFKKVDDGAFSTVFSNTQTQTVSAVTTITSGSSVQTISAAITNTASPSSSSGPDGSSSSSSSSSSSGLSAGAAAGVGVGVGVGVIGLALLGLLLWWRRRRAQKHTGQAVELGAASGAEKSYYSAVAPAPPTSPPPGAGWASDEYVHNAPHEMSTDQQPRPSPAQFSSELDSTPLGSNQTTPATAYKTTHDPWP